MQLAFKSAVLASFMSMSLMAADNQIPSCYQAYFPDLQKPPVQQELFVVIDQTTMMDKNIQQMVLNTAKKFLKPGNAMTVVTFSSNVSGRYMNNNFSGILESDLSQDMRDDQSQKTLRKFDSCMGKQYNFAAGKVYNALKTGFQNSASDIPKSDIFKSLSQFTKFGMRDSRAKEKIVLISSDMIENSSVTSFYDNGAVKSIDPEKEMAKFTKSGLNADFKGARIYVIGAGTTQSDRYHDPKMMQKLERFWSSYFAANNGKLIEFGEPMLMGSVR